MTNKTTSNIKSNQLKERVVLVTGAGDGIGRAAAKCYAENGATVILLGRTVKKLESVYDEIVDCGSPEPLIHPMDLLTATPQDYDELAEAIKQELGKLEGLLHNAGILGKKAPIASYDPNTWCEVMHVNVTAQLMLTQALLPLMEESDDASILFTSSGVGRKSRAFWGAYAASKFATEALMQTLADELEGISNIRVNCINPGATRTRMRAQAFPAEDIKKNPAPEEIMGLYLHLMGPAGKSIHGQSLDAQNWNTPNPSQ